MSGPRKATPVLFGATIICGVLVFSAWTIPGAQPATAKPTASTQTATATPTASAQPAPAPAIPVPAGQNAPDAGERNKTVVQHLNAVLRFYHDAESPIQKVGEPSDLIYRDQAVQLASQIAGYAFQSAKAEAALTAKTAAPDAGTPPQGETQAQRLQAMRETTAQRIVALKAQDAEFERQLATARKRDIPALQQQREEAQGELELQTAMADALGKISTMSSAPGEAGFAAQVGQLERSAPGLTAGKSTAVAPTLENLSAARSAGVTSQAGVLFSLLGTRQSIENLIGQANALHQQALDLRTPLIASLRRTIAQGEELSRQINPQGNATPPTSTDAPTDAQSSPPPVPIVPAAPMAPETLASTRKTFDSLTSTFKAISTSSVPLSQEIMTIEQGQASLQAWRRSVNEEYTSILRSLLLRVMGIAIALFVIFALGEAWRRATTRYVHDVRRRRQLLVVRRLVIGFLSGLVMIFGLVTQFSSLATFAGFITAGLAVGLQTILLSVAAYFFIIGRYGVKVGDRITVAGVTGDVAEVGLVRFYVLELAGAGTDLYPSGRIAVFSNAVLFQAATPLFKQMPGTEYLWHEMTVKLNADSDYRAAVQAMLKSVQSVYDGYREQIEHQHRQLESWMDSSLDAPNIQSSLQLLDGGLQFWARFPVLIRQTTEIDDRMTDALLQIIAGDPRVKAAVTAPPVIKAAVKG